MSTPKLPKLPSNSIESQPLRVSIAMCTFNGERYVLQQLNSILEQRTLPFEIVICDDGSSDNTLNIVQTFAEQAPFHVELVTNSQRLGSTKNFENAIAVCKGEIISLCDQDDVWYPERLETLVSLFQSDPKLGGVFSDGDLIGADGEPLEASLWQSFLFDPQGQDAIARGLVENVFFRQSVVTGATLIFRSSLRDKLLPIPGSWVHDGWLAWMLSLNSKLGLCSKRLIAYRVHSTQQIGAPTSHFSFLRSMAKEGTSQYFKRMRIKHIAEYEETSQRFLDLSQYLQNRMGHGDIELSRHSEAKAKFSGAVAHAIGMPRLLRMQRLAGQATNYFHYSARPIRFMIRDMIL